MTKHLIWICLVLVGLVGCHPRIDKGDRLIGIWYRTEDEFAGSIMEFAAPDRSTLEGRLVRANPSAWDYGFRNGDLKVKQVTAMGPSEFRALSLVKGFGIIEYAEARMTLLSDNELLIEDEQWAERIIGSRQRWVRLTARDPRMAEYWMGHAELEQARQRGREEVAALRKALAIVPDHPPYLNHLAWRLAVATEPTIRNPKEARKLALRACELDGYRSADLVDTLAAAYAACGEFERAVQAQERANSLLKRVPASFTKRLELYRASQPWLER